MCVRVCPLLYLILLLAIAATAVMQILLLLYAMLQHPQLPDTVCAKTKQDRIGHYKMISNLLD